MRKLFRWQRHPERGMKKGGSILSTRIKFIIGGLVLLVVSFVGSFYFFFPATALKERLEMEISANSPATVRLEGLSVHFPAGLKVRRVTLEPGIPNYPSLEFRSAVLKPVWGSLTGDNPGISYRTDLQGGKLQGTIRRNGALQLRASQIPFNTPLSPNLSAALTGVVTQGVLAGAMPLAATTDTRLELALDQVKITNLEAFGVADGVVNLGRIILTGSGRGNSFRVEQMEAGGGDVAITGSGTILLGDTPERSRINLTLALQPAQGLDANVKELLDLFARPGRDGISRLRINGTLANPTLQ
jgi:type II secretion system protein N